MEKKELTPKMLRHRKFLLVAPILVLPFLTMIFWALGGGRMETAQAGTPKAGFNLSLPDANLKDEKAMDKMSYYNQADIDSTKFKALEKNDPNFRKMEGAKATQNPFGTTGANGLNTSISGNGASNDPNTENIYRKLELLNEQLNKPAPAASPYGAKSLSGQREVKQEASVSKGDVDRLEKMMQAMNDSNGEDPELKELNGMLEKIMDIQHPERVKEKLKQKVQNSAEETYSTSVAATGQDVSLLDNNREFQSSGNGFYSLDDTTSAALSENAIPAVVHETQVLVNGSIVKLRLESDLYVNNLRIPKDNFIFGTVALNGERLSIAIKSLRYKNTVLPVELAVFDMDGLDGIHIPGAITRDVAAQSADRSVQNIGVSSLDPSWGAQAASAGIETAKTLFSKKVKLVKVTVKAGYQVLLRDTKLQQAKAQNTNSSIQTLKN